MEHELTTTQARRIDALRRRHPGAELLVHRRPWGVIVEARRRGHTVELERFEFTGASLRDQGIITPALAA
jgi:hypothetical protein